ncbi:MBL fold metallo-hydrolase [Bacillus lacus]|uniref:MBL fold metallo-hydrolase n=1 Tax=Metabacillus lacus TaxID=1983721 RepID=A0A7X2LZV5_9BACI|nr:MBL fold metallo-hydrolase [Metabacillus lacus]MRX72367.1 MBL fold metallo-hydrolase [Metabacillus lacus]
MKIVKNRYLYQVSFLSSLFPVNCYLVEEEEGLTLVDAALPYSAKGILRAAEGIGKPITGIVLTHAHEDHTGALDHLKRALPAVPVYISARDSKLLDGDVSLLPDEPQQPIKGGVPKKLKTRPDVLLHDGDYISSLQAVSAPGHTPGMMAYLDSRTGALLAGDVYHTRGGTTVAGDIRLTFPFPSLATWSRDLNLQSAKKLLELQPTLLATGHGVMLKQPQEEMKAAISRAQKKFSKESRV